MNADFFPVVAIGSTVFLVVGAVIVLILVWSSGREFGRRERSRWSFVQGWHQGRCAERKDREIWEQQGGADAFYPTIVETLPDGSHEVRTPRRPQP